MDTQKNRSLGFLFIKWLPLVLPFAAATVMGIHKWSVDGKIASREKTATAIITSYEPEQHGVSGYSFSVGRIPYTGHCAVGKPVIGQTEVVYYDENDPATNSLIDYTDLSRRDLMGVAFFMVMFGVVSSVIFAIQKKMATPNKKNDGQTN